MRDLKCRYASLLWLTGEFQPIAKNALIMLVNLSDDPQILDNLAPDDAFFELLLQRITVCQSLIVCMQT
jgi:hypothetical protein